MRDCLPISRYFTPTRRQDAEIDSDAVEDPELRVLTIRESTEKSLEVIMPLVNLTSNRRVENRLKQISKYDFVRLRAVRRYFDLILENERSRMESSLKVSRELYPENSCEWKARSIREWASYFLVHHSLPPLTQGKHQKVASLIDCEDVRSSCLSWIRATNPNILNGRSFSDWVRSQLHVISESDPAEHSSSNGMAAETGIRVSATSSKS